MQIIKNVYAFVSSMKTGLVLLGLIGLASALGSGLLPDTFFYMLPFRILLLLLFVNMGLCTLNQISRFLKRRSRTKNRLWFRRLNLLVLHLGVVLILIGGAVNTFYGHSRQVRILQGDTIKISDIIPVKESFSLKLNNFRIEYNEDGSPSQYYSMVTVLNKQNALKDFNISVNHPLNYNGIKTYQTSFGYLINVASEDVDNKTVQLFKEGQFVEFVNTDRKVKVYKYIPNFDPKYGMNSKTLRPDNPRIIYSVYEDGELLGIGAASFGKAVQIGDGVMVRFKGVKPYSVLTIKSDPGLPLAATGGIMLMLGACLVFISPKGKKPEVN